MTTVTTRRLDVRTRIAIGAVALVLNAVFYLLSAAYFDAHKLPGIGVDVHALGEARWAFLTLTLVVATCTAAAAMAPRFVGHVLAEVICLAALVGAYFSISHHMPGVMSAVLIAIGVLLPILGHFSWRGSRAAWSFMISIVCVFGIVTFFGAPKVRGVLGIGFWTAMLLPAVQFVCVAALAMVRSEYRAKA